MDLFNLARDRCFREIRFSRWDGDLKMWHEPFRSYEELSSRWDAIEAAARRAEPEERRRRAEERKGTEEETRSKLRSAERKRRRHPLASDNDKGSRLVMLARHMFVDQDKSMVATESGGVSGTDASNGRDRYRATSYRGEGKGLAEWLKYACHNCDRTGIKTPIVVAPMPQQPLPGSIATASTLAFALVHKYVDGTPLYRLAQDWVAARSAAFAAGLHLGRKLTSYQTASGSS